MPPLRGRNAPAAVALNSTMYRSDLKLRDKGAAIAAVIAIQAVLLLLVLNLSGKMPLPPPQSVLRVFSLADPVPPPPPAPPPKPRDKAGDSPKNIRSEATKIKAPKPKVVVPPLPQIAAAETPRQGTAPTQGASDQRGTGTGAGGTGGGSGTGTGSGGGDNGVAYPPRLITFELTGRDLGPEILDQWPRGTPVFLRLRIDSRGYISECDVSRGTGIPAIDSVMCNLAHERLRFRPALNRAGQPVAGWVGYAQPPPR